MNGMPPAGAQPLWQEAKAPDGRTYYYNTLTKATAWAKPEELMTAAERALLNTPWKEYESKEGRKYWHNKATNQTTWEMPDVLKTTVESQTPQRPPVQQAPTYVAGPASYLPQYSQKHDRYDRDDFQPPERRITDREDRYGGGDRTAAALSSQNDPTFATREEAEAAFMKVLKKAGVQADWTWTQAIRAIIKDPQWKALLDPKDREEAFKKYCDDVRTQEKDKERDRQARLRSDFTSMLQSHPEIKYYTRWRTALPIIEKESIFRSAKDSDERRQLFEEYIVSLKKAHVEKEAKDRKSALDELTEILKELELGPYTQWHDAQEKLKKDDYFAHDEKFKALAGTDVLKAFDSHIKSLERDFNEQRQRAKREKARAERHVRENYLELLSKLKQERKLKAGAKWKDLYPIVREDPSYHAILGQSGSSPLDLFRDALEEEERVFRSSKNDVYDVLEEMKFEVKPETSLSEFLQIVQNHPRTSPIDADSMELIFERVRDHVLQRAEHDKKSKDRRDRHTVDNFRNRLKRMDPPITVGETYEQVRPRIEKTSEFRDFESEDQAQHAFDKFIRRLKEKEDETRERGRRDARDRDRDRRSDKHREYRNGESHRRHRTRTRSPEPDAYEADRKKAMADRESRYKKAGSTGLSPKHRRGRDEYRGRYDRASREGSGGHYERERRERDDQRERSYVSRADPRDAAELLDYGESGPAVPTRRRRESDGNSPASRRDNKRVRRDTRERTFSPRLDRDRRSKTPAVVTEPPKEDPGLRSGSEEGEIEED